MDVARDGRGHSNDRREFGETLPGECGSESRWQLAPSPLGVSFLSGGPYRSWRRARSCRQCAT
jgi:hypothetical protein